MYLARLIRLLLVALSIATVAQAIRVDNARAVPNGALVKRQRDTDTPDDETSTPPDPTPTTPPDDDETTSTTSTRNTDDNTTPTETSPPETSDTETATESASDPTETNEEETEEPTLETRTTVITTTNSDGLPTSITSESTVTRTPGLSGDDEGGSSGMSPQTRSIVIGVVVGVGGAIILGALGFVAWRIWGRKKAAEEPDHFATLEPMDKSDAGGSAGGGVVGQPRNPFQQTLETYHAPTQVNASSNF